LISSAWAILAVPINRLGVDLLDLPTGISLPYLLCNALAVVKDAEESATVVILADRERLLPGGLRLFAAPGDHWEYSDCELVRVVLSVSSAAAAKQTCRGH
jgi:hypothetical protein